MVDKQINTCEFLNICQTDCNGTLEDTEVCHCYELYKQLERKEQECEELEGRLKYIRNENKALKDCATDEHIDILALKNYISTLEFQLNQLKAENEELKAKEQECNKLYIQLKADEEYHKEEENTLRKIIKNKEERNIELYKENNQLKVNNEKMSKGYAELTEIVRPYIEDFTGYNKKLTKTIIEIKEYLIKECKICKEQCAITNEDCADCQAQEILQKLSEVEHD